MTDFEKLTTIYTRAAQFVRGGDETSHDILGHFPAQPLGEKLPIIRIGAEIRLLDLVGGVPHGAG